MSGYCQYWTYDQRIGGVTDVPPMVEGVSDTVAGGMIGTARCTDPISQTPGRDAAVPAAGQSRYS